MRSKRVAAFLAVAGALHGAVFFHEDLEEGVETAGHVAENVVRNIRKEAGQAFASKETKKMEKETLDNVKNAFEKKEELRVDLSTFYLSTEGLKEGLSAGDTKAAEARYAEIIGNAKALRDEGRSETEVLGFILKQQGKYKSHDELMTDLLVRGEGNCEARMKYITSAVEDVYPEEAKAGNILVQDFGSYTDESGKFREGHVRAVLDAGESFQILEGSAVKTTLKSEESAPAFEAHWLAVTSYLAGQAEISYKDMGLDTDGEAAPLGYMGSDSFLTYPASSAHYGSGNDGLKDIAPKPIKGSWGKAAEEKPKGPLAVDFLYVSPEEMKKESERLGAVKKGWEEKDKESLANKGIDFWPATHRERTSAFDFSGAIFNLSKANEQVPPITSEEIERAASTDGLSFVLRGDQSLPPGIEHALDPSAPLQIQVEGEPGEATLETARHFTNIEMLDLSSIPQFLRENNEEKIYRKVTLGIASGKEVAAGPDWFIGAEIEQLTVDTSAAKGGVPFSRMVSQSHATEFVTYYTPSDYFGVLEENTFSQALRISNVGFEFRGGGMILEPGSFRNVDTFHVSIQSKGIQLIESRAFEGAKISELDYWLTDDFKILPGAFSGAQINKLWFSVEGRDYNHMLLSETEAQAVIQKLRSVKFDEGVKEAYCVYYAEEDGSKVEVRIK